MSKQTRTASEITVAIEPIAPVIIAPEQLVVALSRPLPVIAF
jgi:hypothetical protein